VILSLALLFMLALSMPIAGRLLGDRASAVAGPGAALVVFGTFLWFLLSGTGSIGGAEAGATTAASVWQGQPRSEMYAWVPDLGLSFAFRLDGLSLLFALLITGIGSLVLLYTSSYLAGHPRIGTFLGVLVAFMASMLGLVLADNLILLFIFWELTSITSFLLIGFEHERASARKAAIQALLVTGSGGLLLLAGLIVLAIGTGSFSLSEIVSAPRGTGPSAIPGYEAAAILLLLAAFTKSAGFPFHFWLPNAMEAPSPVSALLHSSTMVKAGIYLVARTHPAMGGTALWDDALIIVGGLTMLGAAFVAMQQRALKKVLAYSTVSSLGALFLLLGLGAIKAAAVYLLAHALFKAALFLIAGSVTHATHEKDPERLGGLRRSMPVTAAAALVAALSMAGAFPLLGFVGKELLLKAGLAHPEWRIPATIAIVIAGTCTVVSALLVGLKPFIGSAPAHAHADDHGGAHESNWRELLGPVLLVALSAIVGLAPSLMTEPVVRGVLAAVDPFAKTAEASGAAWKLQALELLWPPSLATALSILALVAGGTLFAFRSRVMPSIAWAAPPFAKWPELAYHAIVDGLLALAAFHNRVMTGGSLRTHARLVFAVTAGVLLTALIASGVAVIGPSFSADAFGDMDVASALLYLIATVAGCGLVAMRSAMGKVAVLGVIGFAIAALFARLASPDVALTQITVESLIVIIFVLAILHLPETKSISRPRSRIVDACIASALGIAVAGITLIAVRTPTPNPISAYFATASVPEGYGRNVVNVILVDFRALDTFGEITVVGVAALGVAAIIGSSLRRAAGRRTPASEGNR
jgi:multicomponent Na+:H+ antiporter subunit A